MRTFNQFITEVNRQPWQMTRDEWSSFEYAPLPDGGNTPQAKRVANLLRHAGVDVLDIQVRGSHALGAATSKSDFDIYVRVPEGQFHLADDLVAPLSREGIDVLLNWKGVGKPGGTLRGEKTHRRLVAKALADGKPVPPAVLADYPEL